jgi:hypothetical protein
VLALHPAVRCSCTHIKHNINSARMVSVETFFSLHTSSKDCRYQQVLRDLGDEMVNQALENKQQKYGVTVEVLSYLKMYKNNQYNRSSISEDATLLLERGVPPKVR